MAAITDIVMDCGSMMRSWKWWSCSITGDLQSLRSGFRCFNRCGDSATDMRNLPGCSVALYKALFHGGFVGAVFKT